MNATRGSSSSRLLPIAGGAPAQGPSRSRSRRSSHFLHWLPRAHWGALGPILLALCAVPLAVDAAPPAAKFPIRFAVTDLGIPFGAIFFNPTGLNNRGQVVGVAYYPASPMGGLTSRAAQWSHGVYTDLGALFPGVESSAQDINDRGQVVVTTGGDFLTPVRSFVYTPGATPLVTPITDDRLTFLKALAINDRGVVAGIAGPPKPTSPDGETPDFRDTLAFVYENGVLTRFGSRFVEGISEAHSLNNVGVVVGDDFGCCGPGGGVIFTGGQILALDFLPRAINNRGQIAGWAPTPTSHSHAFLFRHGVTRDLGTFEGDVESFATDLNDFGQVVGVSSILDREQDRAFLYSHGAMFDLNDFVPRHSGWYLRVAKRINDRGQIVGYGLYRGEERSFLLTPRQRIQSD